MIENYDPPGVELYDLEADEGETVDLAEKMPERAANMRRKIHDWLRESGAKLHRENPAYRPSKGE